MLVIIKESDLMKAKSILEKYNSKSKYSILSIDNQRYAVFESGIAAALIEIDMKLGMDYKEGRVTSRD